MKKIVTRILNNRGVSMLNVLIILMILMIIVSFMFQIFVIYSTANMVRTSTQDAVLSVAAVNKPIVFESLREGITAVKGETVPLLLTTDELSDKLCETLGLTKNENMLVRNGTDNYLYSINNLSVTLENINSHDREVSLTFVTTFELEIPIAEYWNFGSITIPMTVKSRYTSKY